MKQARTPMILAAVAVFTLALMTAPVFADAVADDARSPLFVNNSAALEMDVDTDAFGGATALPSSYRHFDLNRRLGGFGLQADPEDGDVETVSTDETSAMADATMQKHPGRALLLSAILPGAGELYAGKPWRAAGFFALEMAAWVGAVYYAQQGEDKETEYEKFADEYYHEPIYRTVEYQAGVDPTAGQIGFDGTESEWATLSWQDKLQYLPGNFTHELATERNQSWYENVGKYLTQFGYGWDDYVNGRASQDIVAEAANWDYVWRGSAAPTPTALMAEYIDMRAESNDLLDRSALFFSVIMVNHVASALHAGFTVRAMNQDLEVAPEAGQIYFNNQFVHTAGVRVKF